MAGLSPTSRDLPAPRMFIGQSGGGRKGGGPGMAQPVNNLLWGFLGFPVEGQGCWPPSGCRAGSGRKGGGPSMVQPFNSLFLGGSPENSRLLAAARMFIGQSGGGRKGGGPGMAQREQKAVLAEFRAGGFNTLVATCIGEEGLDIPQVRPAHLHVGFQGF